MTREQMISTLRGMDFGSTIGSKGDEALRMAIAELEQEPTDTWSIKDVADTFKKHGLIRDQEPCTDAVSRQAVLEMAYDMSEIDGEHFTEPHMIVDVEDIQKLPSVTQKPKTGHWIYNRHKQGVTCSECDAYRKYFGFFEFYCPNCGTRMSDEPCIEEMPYVTGEEMQKCKEVVRKYTPSVTQKSGKWIPIYQGDEIINYRCSECELGDTNGSTNLYGWDYCRRCGAKMVEPQERSDKE